MIDTRKAVKILHLLKAKENPEGEQKDIPVRPGKKEWKDFVNFMKRNPSAMMSLIPASPV